MNDILKIFNLFLLFVQPVQTDLKIIVREFNIFYLFEIESLNKN